MEPDNILSAKIAMGGGAGLRLKDLLLEFKVGQSSQVVNDLLMRRVSAKRAIAEGITVKEEELEEAMSDFFAERDLLEDSEIDAWLAGSKITREQIKDIVEEELLSSGLLSKLAPDNLIEQRFQATLHDYTTVSVKVLAVPSEGAASELALALREGEMNWDEASRRAGPSVDVALTRKNAQESIAGLLLSAAPGQVLGPVESDEGDCWNVYLVMSRSEPELTDELRREIGNLIVSEHLQGAFDNQPVEYMI